MVKLGALLLGLPMLPDVMVGESAGIDRATCDGSDDDMCLQSAGTIALALVRIHVVRSIAPFSAVPAK